jgi:hypothetical protein
VIRLEPAHADVRIDVLSSADRVEIRRQGALLRWSADPLGGPGLNVAVFDETTRQLLHKDSFDTSASSKDDEAASTATADHYFE